MSDQIPILQLFENLCLSKPCRLVMLNIKHCRMNNYALREVSLGD
jgi:hypothetical protein